MLIMPVIVKNEEQLNGIIGNYVAGVTPLMKRSEIVFNGTGNVLFCEEGVTLVDSKISFSGDNSLIYLSKSRHNYPLNISIYNNSTLYFGRDNYINPTKNLNLILSEEHNVFIGSNCLFSFDIWFRNADPHLVYSTETNMRINPTKSIYVGDHVWVGQSVIVLKGSKIHSGSIIGAMSLIAGKEILSNESWGGNPIQRIASNITWSKECVHRWTETKSKKYEQLTSRTYIYKSSSKDYIDFDWIENELTSRESAFEKSEFLKDLSENRSKNRFAKSAVKKKSLVKRIKQKLAKLKF